MKSDVYRKECLEKILIPFINQHHETEDVLFWPDLAPIHYANIVRDFLTEKEVDFVQKTESPPNVPQARGIEKFWAECKRLYNQRPEPAKNLRGFRQIWKKNLIRSRKNECTGRYAPRLQLSPTDWL
jgi:hypothetical protein